MNNSEDYIEFKANTLNLLQMHGIEIGKLANKGNDLCKRIIQNYALLYNSYDPFIHQLIKMDLDIYLHGQE